MKHLLVTMIIIILLFTACSSEVSVVSKEKHLEGGTELEQIFEIVDEQKFVYAMCDYIGAKCNYGMNMSVLSSHERAFYITQLLEMEVSNGGFCQFFFNSAGDYANEVVVAYESMGAVKTAEICRRANSIYGDFVPIDRDERYEILLEDDAYDAILEECDEAFFSYEEDIYCLIRDYVMENRDAFT